MSLLCMLKKLLKSFSVDILYFFTPFTSVILYINNQIIITCKQYRQTLQGYLQYQQQKYFKMRIISMHVLRWHEENSFFIASAYDLSFVSWYQRPFFKQTVNFGARTSANRTKVGESISVHLPEAKAKCYIYISKDQYAFCLLADDQYPERVAFMAIRKMMAEYNAEFGMQKYNKIESDQNLTWKKMDQWIKKFQDPKQVDKLEKLKSQLNEVQKICHKNMDDLLKRGEDLDQLMEKSKDVNKISLDFYKQAKKANTKCCSLY